MANINIKFLAEKLQLSPSTVSRALNDSHEISQATKDRVLDLAKSLNYRPNPLARGLRVQKSNTIALILPERINNFFSQVIEGVEEIIQAHGYQLIVYTSHENVEQERKIISHLLGGRVDAMIVSVSSQTSGIDHLQMAYEQGMPIIFFDRVINSIPTTRFITNDYTSAYEATKHLIRKGCKKIIFLLISEEISIGRERLKGYKDALLAEGLTFHESLVVHCSNDEEKNFKLLHQIFYAIDRPDGVLASVEKLAMTAYYALRETKIKIPDKVKIISFSNMGIADLLDPPLSTINQPAKEIGNACAKLLIQKLKHPKSVELSNETIMLPSKCHWRKSSGDD